MKISEMKKLLRLMINDIEEYHDFYEELFRGMMDIRGPMDRTLCFLISTAGNIDPTSVEKWQKIHFRYRKNVVLEMRDKISEKIFAINNEVIINICSMSQYSPAGHAIHLIDEPNSDPEKLMFNESYALAVAMNYLYLQKLFNYKYYESLSNKLKEPSMIEGENWEENFTRLKQNCTVEELFHEFDSVKAISARDFYNGRIISGFVDRTDILAIHSIERQLDE